VTETSRPIPVLWLIKGLGPGGAERLLVAAAAHVDRERFSYQAAYLLPWKNHLVVDLEGAGVPVTCLGARRSWDMRWATRLRDLVGRERVSVVHAHLPYAAIGARLALGGRGTRPAIVYTEHNTWARYRPVTRRLNEATFRRNDAVIAVSESVNASIGRRDPPPVHVIPNGVDAEGLRKAALSREAARRALGLPQDGLVVGTVGGLTPKKGHPALVRAADEVLRQVPSVVFVIIGLPAQPEPVRAEIDRLGRQDRVLLAGYHPNAARLMPAFDVFCLPSLFEGLPVSLLEAMSLGLPAVATRVGGIAEVATDGEDALLVPAGDDDALALALVTLLKEPARRARMGQRAMSSADRFGLAGSVRRTEEVYLLALEGSR
jgi:glycosyltransferase involved in cell wall biosynthesis